MYSDWSVGSTVARQAIFDAAGARVGVELLYRRPPADTAPAMLTEQHHEQATTAVIHRLEEDVAESSGPVPDDGLLFLNVPRAFIVGEQPLPPDVDRLVVEVLEGVDDSPEVVAGITRLRSRGYRIAIDDWEGGCDRVRLLALADYVKIDLEAVTAARLPSLVAEARVLAPGAVVIVERIEDADDLQTAVEAGADLLQGFHLAWPRLD